MALFHFIILHSKAPFHKEEAYKSNKNLHKKPSYTRILDDIQMYHWRSSSGDCLKICIWMFNILTSTATNITCSSQPTWLAFNKVGIGKAYEQKQMPTIDTKVPLVQSKKPPQNDVQSSRFYTSPPREQILLFQGRGKKRWRSRVAVIGAYYVV